MRFNRKDFFTGVIFAGFALVYGYLSLVTLPLGTPTRMGPGFFPAMLCGMLLLIAAVLVVRSFVDLLETPFGEFAWRAVIVLTVSIVVFAATARGLGMLPGTFVAAVIACGASRQIGPGRALATAAGISVFCTLVFTEALGVPLPVLGTWFGG